MNRTVGLSAALLLSLAACGGGGGGGDGSMVDDEARRAVLADLGEHLVLPTLRTLDTRMAALAAEVEALSEVPGNAAARDDAQAAWRTAMDSVERAELLQFGPAGRAPEAGAMDLRDRIYAYPQLNLCAVHNAAYADDPVDAGTPINVAGMGALEYLLFVDEDDPACPPGQGVDGSAKRAQYAARVAAHAADVAAQLRDAWEPGGGDFLGEFASAGNGSMVYDTSQMALQAIWNAIFYAEKETKDRKIANPTGIGATGLPPCGTTSCPERVESPFARASGDHLRANLEIFRALFTGANGGLGFNDLLTAINAGDLATRIVGEIDEALAALDDLEPDFETAVESIESNEACINAVASRSGEPACALLGFVDRATDTMRAEITSTLNLQIPGNAAGDND